MIKSFEEQTKVIVDNLSKTMQDRQEIADFLGYSEIQMKTIEDQLIPLLWVDDKKIVLTIK